MNMFSWCGWGAGGGEYVNLSDTQKPISQKALLKSVCDKKCYENQSIKKRALIKTVHYEKHCQKLSHLLQNLLRTNMHLGPSESSARAKSRHLEACALDDRMAGRATKSHAYYSPSVHRFWREGECLPRVKRWHKLVPKQRYRRQLIFVVNWILKSFYWQFCLNVQNIARISKIWQNDWVLRASSNIARVQWWISNIYIHC